MTTQEANAYFHDYADAFDRFDTEAIADFMDVPLTVTSGDGSAAFTSREAVVANFEAVNDLHRELGYHRAELKECAVVRSLTPALVEVDTEWTFWRKDGREIYTFAMTYVLRHADGWKVSTAIQR